MFLLIARVVFGLNLKNSIKYKLIYLLLFTRETSPYNVVVIETVSLIPNL